MGGGGSVQESFWELGVSQAVTPPPGLGHGCCEGPGFQLLVVTKAPEVTGLSMPPLGFPGKPVSEDCLGLGSF